MLRAYAIVAAYLRLACRLLTHRKGAYRVFPRLLFSLLPCTAAGTLLAQPESTVHRQVADTTVWESPADTPDIDAHDTVFLEEISRLMRLAGMDEDDIHLHLVEEPEVDTTSSALSFEPPAEQNEEATRCLSAAERIEADSTRLTDKGFTPEQLDPEMYRYNPLFGELVFRQEREPLSWRANDSISPFYGVPRRTLGSPFDKPSIPRPDQVLFQLRREARDHITRTNVLLYTTTADRLPQVDWTDNKRLDDRPIKDYAMSEYAHAPVVTSDRIVVRSKEYSPWSWRLNSLLQFSQTAVSKNWYDGGHNFFLLLGGLNGYLNYDNRKRTKWENSFEWRMGFNTVTGDTIGPKGGRSAMPSDDVLKLNSKFGIQATGNFYYSATADFQTYLFDNPAELNSYEDKARLFTPIRINLGIGMEYKYNWLSVNLSPLSFKFIYLTDTAVVDGFYIKPTEFGIEEGGNRLAELGSTLTVETKDYSPIPELKINSKFYFYTNYRNVEIDWEIVAEFAINRFLSTRLLLNPRFDNTVILTDDQKAKLQMKQMLTVGLSYRIL